MRHVVRHDLDDATALRVARHVTEAYRERYARFSPHFDWVTEHTCEVRFTVRGISVMGEVELEPGSIALEVDVPLLLRPFRSQAMRAIEQEVGRWVERAKRGEV